MDLSTNYTKVSCLALEDSPNGVRSGLAAGMTVLQMTNMCGSMDDGEIIALTQEFSGRYIPMEFSELQDILSSSNVAPNINGASALMEQHLGG